ncbi:MAG: glutathione S-transferase family protein [Steroidobacteraceae bacterium]
MLLIGMFDSPFVRRVAISLRLLGIPYEHANWSVGRDFERIRAYNPLGRVPTLVLDDGEALLESAAILDHLDERAGPGRALLPPSGPERRAALRLMAIATGGMEKAVAQVYEVAFRPPEKRHAAWVERCRGQMLAAAGELERACAARGTAPWLLGARCTQADITAACAFTFMADAGLLPAGPTPFPAWAAHAARCEAMEEFRAVRAPWSAPKSG